MRNQDAYIYNIIMSNVEVDVRLKLRSVDVDFWRGELDTKLAAIKEEIDEVDYYYWK